MSEDFLVRYLALAMVAAAKSAVPALIVAAVVGFLIAMFQGVTQIQDQSLPLTIKIIAVGALLLFFGAGLASPVFVLADEAFRVFPTASR